MIGRLGRQPRHPFCCWRRSVGGRPAARAGLDNLSLPDRACARSPVGERSLLGVDDAYTCRQCPARLLKYTTRSRWGRCARPTCRRLPSRGAEATVRTPGTHREQVAAYRWPRRKLTPPHRKPREQPKQIESDSGEPIMGAMVYRLVGKGPAAAQQIFWLQPLDEPGHDGPGDHGSAGVDPERGRLFRFGVAETGGDDRDGGDRGPMRSSSAATPCGRTCPAPGRAMPHRGVERRRAASTRARCVASFGSRAHPTPKEHSSSC